MTLAMSDYRRLLSDGGYFFFLNLKLIWQSIKTTDVDAIKNQIVKIFRYHKMPASIWYGIASPTLKNNESQIESPFCRTESANVLFLSKRKKK